MLNDQISNLVFTFKEKRVSKYKRAKMTLIVDTDQLEMCLEGALATLTAIISSKFSRRIKD